MDDESTLAVLDGRKSAGLGHGGVAGLETARWRTLAVLDGQGSTGWANGGTVALLDGRQLDERSLAVLDGRDSASWVYGGVAGRETAE